MFSKRLEETVDWGIRSKIQSTGTQFPRTGDNAKHPIEEFRNDSSGIIGPRGQSTERKHCPPTVFDATTVKGHVDHHFQRSTGRGWSPRTIGSQRNRTKHLLAHVLIVCSSIDMIWGVRRSWGIRKSLIEPVRSILNPKFHLVGVKLRIDPSEPKTFWSSQLYLNQFFQRSYHRWQ